MARPAPVYDLTLVLDPRIEEGTRAKVLADTRSAVEAKGELLRHDEWGERPLAYPIRRSTSGEYHLLQFHAGSTSLLGELDHTLHITDGILRFRLIKLRPGVPEAPDMRFAAPAARPAEPPAEPAQQAEPQQPAGATAAVAAQEAVEESA
jgi:small subunit ribosomal protein S6